MEDGEFFIARQEFDTILLRAHIELLQRVNRLVEILEKEHGKQEEGKSDGSSSVVETSP